MAKKDIEMIDETNEEQDADHAEVRVYELGFHIDPELGSEGVKKVWDAIRLGIEKNGTIVAEGMPQKIQLAYTVSRGETAGRRDFDSSFFAWIAYEANGAGHEAVGALAKETLSIFRFIDVRTDKEAAKHFSEMQELLAKAPANEVVEEEVLETDLDTALKQVEV